MPYSMNNTPNSSSSLDSSSKDNDIMLQNLTRSVSGLIRNNIYRALREMPDSEEFIVMEDIDKIMDTCLGGRSTFSGQVPDNQLEKRALSQQQQHQQQQQRETTQIRTTTATRISTKSATNMPKSSKRQSYRDIMHPQWDSIQSSLDHLISDTLQTASSSIVSSQAEIFERFRLPTLGKFTGTEMQPTSSQAAGRYQQQPTQQLPLTASSPLFAVSGDVDTLLSELERNKLLVENFSILEARLNQLECRISEMLQAVPNIREYQRKKFKINTQLIREELKQLIHNAETYKEPTPPAEPKPLRNVEEREQNNGDDSSTLTGGEAEKEENEGEDNDTTSESASELTLVDTQESRSILSGFEEQSVDEYFYERRQNMINRLYFKKSVGTIALHQRRQQNLPYIGMQVKAPITSKRPPRDPRYPYFLEMSEKAKRVDMDDGDAKK